ncbi:ABC transporter permease [Paenibacillus sp. FSL R10-2736]|uniref:ABC transporter permease n=1 Tax=Paenibacillus sp. FSL R10-2736 TaxID=2954692 RepID=UPI0030F90F9B
MGSLRPYNRYLYKAVAGSTLPVLLLVLWQVLGDQGRISTLLFPTPSTIFNALTRLYQTGELGDNLSISLQRALYGFALGGGLGFMFGLLVGFFRFAERSLDPTIQMIRMIPHLAVTTLFVLWFGIGETSKILLIAKGAFFPLYINTYLGIRNVDRKYFEVAKVLGFSRLKQIVRLVIPASLPNIFLGIRLSVAVTWLGLVVAEIMGSTSGIGYLMMDARSMGMTSVVFVGILLFAVCGKISDMFVVGIERRCLKWRDHFQGN